MNETDRPVPEPPDAVDTAIDDVLHEFGRAALQGDPIAAERALRQSLRDLVESVAAERVRATEADLRPIVAHREARAREEAITQLLDTVGDLADALDGVKNLLAETSASGATKTLEMRLDRLFGALDCERIATVDTPFDPALHEAVSREPDAPAGVVVREVTRGYRRGELVLRPARVVVGGD